MPKNNIWVIDDDQSIRWVLEKTLSKADYNVTVFETASEALIQFKKGATADCVLTDVRMPGIDGFEFLKQVKKLHSDLPIIIMTAYSDLDTTVKAYQDGAFEYLPKPFDIEDVLEITQKACASTTSKTKLEASEDLPITDQIIGDSAEMQDVFRVIGRLSKSHISVLINGESGTGKELVAKALHIHSPRSENPFIAINTAAIPKDLLESELFGHEKGAFTGANSERKGRFEQAHEGTLFLDEIGDMPMSLQTRLLRVLAEGCFYRVGGNQSVYADVRVIAATHHDLKKRVEEGVFREDLYHRINVIQIHLPALRERKQDIPLLLSHYLQQTAAELKQSNKTLSPEVKQYLTEYAWKGNVRQLENTCRWFSVMATGDEITLHDLPEDLKPDEADTKNLLINSLSPHQWSDLLSQQIDQLLNDKQINLIKILGDEFEKTLLKSTLMHTKGRKQEAAKIIGWGRNTITRKIKELLE